MEKRLQPASFSETLLPVEDELTINRIREKNSDSDQNEDTTEESTNTTEQHIALEVKQDLSSFQYGMNNKYRGLAVIFNHDEFARNDLSSRNGSIKDVEALLNCLPYLGFRKEDIIVEHNLKTHEVMYYSHKLLNEKEDMLRNSDCLAIFILSHGFKDNIIYTNNSSYDLYRFVDLFTSNFFEVMCAKPKLFFVQACRGQTLDDGKWQCNKPSHMQNSTGDTIDGNTSGWVKELRPSHSDILISHCSYHDHAAFRNDNGSWYIQDLCKAIEHYKVYGQLETIDISEILTYTNYFTSKRSTEGDYQDKKQCPVYSSGLSRKLCFKR